MDVFEQVNNFIRWYRDLYGRTLYLENPLREGPREGEWMTTVARSGQVSTPLQQFKKEIENCMNCALGSSRTKFVFGSGNEQADLMFVGEAPGRDEDLQGVPFVGRAGQLLTRLLQSIQLNRSDVYIANILKCRPPNNRDPLPEEVEKCLPYLHRQIELVQPKLLVALGRVAGQNLLNTTESLKNLRRKIWQFQNTPLIITFHPAYILRYPNMMDAALEDMKFIRKHYQHYKA